MFKKLNNKTLFLILAVLVGAYFLSTMLGSNNESSFKADLVKLDTAKVTSILIYPKNEGHEEIKMFKEGGAWKVQKGSIIGKVDPNAPSAMLSTISNIKPKRLAAVSKDKWADYEVTDSLGTRVKAMAGGKVLADIMLGKFAFKQQPQSMTTYMRMTDEKEVYAIDGPLSMSFNRSFDSFRDRSFLSLNKANVTKVAMNNNGQSSMFGLGPDGKWSGVDSIAIDGYLNKLATLRGTTFKDGFTAGAPASTLTIEGNNMASTTVSCYPDENGFVLGSSQNPGIFFHSDSAGVYKTLFSDFGLLSH